MEHIVTAMERFKHQHQSGPSPLRSDHSSSGELPSTYVVKLPTRSVTASLSGLRERRVLAAYEKKGPFLNAYRTLRTQVMHRLQENGWKLLGVTSPGKQEGKSLTAINLAISMAMDLTQTVLLVEADFGNPSLHQVFGITDGAGLADYLLENVPLQELLVHPGIDRLMLLPVGRQIPNCSEALTSPRMLSLVKELKTHYPSLVIIFDLPAVLSDPAVLTFMPQIDATLLVVEEAKTTVQDLEHAMELLKGATPIIGTVLNKANHLKAIQRA